MEERPAIKSDPSYVDRAVHRWTEQCWDCSQRWALIVAVL
jgi:hypothetical protein